MRIDYDAIKKEALNQGISPYFFLKKKLNYRKANNIFKNCNSCKNISYIRYKESEIMQCKIIGESAEKDSLIKPDRKCDAYKKT